LTLSQINPNQLRPPGDDGHGPIVQVGRERLAEAVERLVSAAPPHGDRDHAQRFIEYAQAQRIALDFLWARLDAHGRVCATVLAVPSPGRTAMVFASRLGPRQSQAALGGLIRLVCRRLGETDVNLAQALLEPGESLEREAFRAGGFRDLATLSYLERPLRAGRGSRTQPVWPTGAAPIPYDDSMRHSLRDILEQSYLDTLDCPGLRGLRTPDDILEGHRASGVFIPALWTILLVDGVPAGTLLLNPSHDQQTVELVYLGLIKSVRGRGLGAQLLRHGLALLHRRKERSVHLAVDEANAPAIALYRREGFRPVQRRCAMIQPLSR
jgi:hypothetical protein